MDTQADLTILAPNNAAFAALDDEVNDFLLSDEGQPVLQDLLLYHALPNGPHPSDQLPTGPQGTARGGNEMVEFITDVNGRVGVQGATNQATVITTDLLANNGA